MKNKNLQKLKDDWFAENEPLGKQLGFPDCCIKEFCNQPPALLKKRIPTQDDLTRYKAAFVDGQYTGFIPCAFHAKEITTGKITLVSLIKNRNPYFKPFPNF